MRTFAPQGDDWAHEPTRFRKALIWFRHNSSRFMIGTATTIFVGAVVGHFTDQSSLWAAGLFLMLGLLWWWSMGESGRHALRWCERCIWKRAVENGTEAAEEKRRQLRLFHLQHDHPLWSRFVYASLAVALLFADGGVGLVVFSVFLGFTVVDAWTDSVHCWHQLHCPWCRRGDGGDDRRVVEPVPDPSDSAPVAPQMVDR